MPSFPNPNPQGDVKSVNSMQELDPSPEDDLTPDLESGEYSPPEDRPKRTPGTAGPTLGLRAYRWDALRRSSPKLGAHLISHRKFSLRSSKILDLSFNGILHPTLRQHLAHPAHHTFRTGERAISPAHEAHLPGAWTRAFDSHDPCYYACCCWNCFAQYPWFAARSFVRGRGSCSAQAAVLLASTVSPSAYGVHHHTIDWASCPGEPVYARDGGGWQFQHWTGVHCSWCRSKTRVLEYLLCAACHCQCMAFRGRLGDVDGLESHHHSPRTRLQGLARRVPWIPCHPGSFKTPAQDVVDGQWNCGRRSCFLACGSPRHRGTRWRRRWMGSPGLE